MLASPGSAPVDAGWALEVKWDGIRAQLRFDGRRVCVRSRPGRDCTAEFPELAAIAEPLGSRRVILDGELVCLDTAGRPDFAALRARLGRPTGRHRGGRAPAMLMVFDVLHLDGRAVRRLPYSRRRELLEGLGLDGPAWRKPRHFIGQSERVLAVTRDMRLKGVVAKRLDAPYREGRSRAWIKHKHRRRERLFVTGWRERDGERPEFLLARAGADGRLRPAGSAGMGLDVDQRTELLEALAARELPRHRGRTRVRWVKPGVEVLVDAHGSVEGPVRDAILRGLRSHEPRGRGDGRRDRADPQAQSANGPELDFQHRFRCFPLAWLMLWTVRGRTACWRGVTHRSCPML
jgi:bifunctional non-homologous end joining protein LigD